MKERITITIEKELLRWLDSKIKDKIFANRSHGLEFLIKGKIDEEKRQKNGPDLITPKSMSNLFSSLYFSTVLEPESSEYLLSLLTKNNFDIKKIADLPDNIKVAQKFGENYYGNNRFFHSCGIMYIDETRIFYCIMTKDLDEETAVETISVLVNEIYKYAKETRAKLAVYKG